MNTALTDILFPRQYLEQRRGILQNRKTNNSNSFGLYQRNNSFILDMRKTIAGYFLDLVMRLDLYHICDVLSAYVLLKSPIVYVYVPIVFNNLFLKQIVKPLKNISTSEINVQYICHHFQRHV